MPYVRSRRAWDIIRLFLRLIRQLLRDSHIMDVVSLRVFFFRPAIIIRSVLFLIDILLRLSIIIY
jgi:hypothetical protein